ncbi:MAG: hypothetical protein AAF721_10910 [Myxococcota bacterium]
MTGADEARGGHPYRGVSQGEATPWYVSPRDRALAETRVEFTDLSSIHLPPAAPMRPSLSDVAIGLAAFTLCLVGLIEGLALTLVVYSELAGEMF